MINRGGFIKFLSVFVVMSFVFVGAARAAGEDVVAPAQEPGEYSAEQQLCLDSGGEWNDDTCMCSAEKNLVFDENEKQCACKDGYVVEEGQSLKEGGKCVEAKSAAQTACEGEDSLGTWTNGECVCRSGYFFDSTTGKCYKGAANDLQTACTGSGGTWDSGCTCGKEHSSFLNGYCVCDYGYVVSGGNSLGDANATCARDTGMKIATTAYNNARFSGVQSDLNNAVTKIKSVVVQALANAANVATVSSTKQTRPDDLHACAAGKTCLLVTTPAGVNNWYEIVDCSADNVLSGVNFDGENVPFGPGEPWGWKIASSSGNLMCSSSDGISCPDNTWVTSYDKNSSNVGDEIVFGTMQRVAIAERTRGSIVRLPTSGLQSGDVCVCKATKYKLWDSGTSSYGPDHDINTDKWFVAGIATSDSQCFDKCGDDRINGISKEAYYRDISNTCSADAEEANMCRYHEFFNTVVSGGQYEHVGSVDVGSDGWSACYQPTGYFSTGGHCVNGGWVIEYTFNGGTQSGYVWGRAGYVTLPQGTSVGDVVDITNANDFSLTSSPSHNAYVCIVDGYRGINASSDQTLGFTKAYVAQVDGSNSVIGSLNATGCAEWAQNPSAVANQLGGYYTDLAEVCDVY